MRISTIDPRVIKASKLLREKYDPGPAISIAEEFSKEYHCRIISEDPWGLEGQIEFTDEKWYNWFIMKFGAGDE